MQRFHPSGSPCHGGNWLLLCYDSWPFQGVSTTRFAGCSQAHEKIAYHFTVCMSVPFEYSCCTEDSCTSQIARSTRFTGQLCTHLLVIHSSGSAKADSLPEEAFKGFPYLDSFLDVIAFWHCWWKDSQQWWSFFPKQLEDEYLLLLIWDTYGFEHILACVLNMWNSLYLLSTPKSIVATYVL